MKDSDDGDTRMIYDQSSDIIMKDEKYVRRDLYMRDFSDCASGDVCLEPHDIVCGLAANDSGHLYSMKASGRSFSSSFFAFHPGQ